MGVSPALCSRGLVAFLYAAFAGQGSKSAILHLGPWTNVVLDPSQRLLLDGPAQRGPCTARGDPLSGMPVSKQQDAPVEAPLLQLGLLCFVYSRGTKAPLRSGTAAGDAGCVSSMHSPKYGSIQEDPAPRCSA